MVKLKTCNKELVHKMHADKHTGIRCAFWMKYIPPVIPFSWQRCMEYTLLWYRDQVQVQWATKALHSVATISWLRVVLAAAQIGPHQVTHGSFWLYHETWDHESWRCLPTIGVSLWSLRSERQPFSSKGERSDSLAWLRLNNHPSYDQNYFLPL